MGCGGRALPYNRGVIMHTSVLGSSWVGQQIEDRLTLQEWLGSTDIGDVFRTELPESKRAAILVASAENEGAAERLRDWEAAAELNHPHILRAFECGRAQVEGSDVVYLVTELPDEALGQVLPERALTADETGEMLGPILEALAYLHARGLVHGHVEPANVLVVGDQLKLSADGLQAMGSVRRRNDRPRIYEAPETGSGAVTAAADVWSLGITLIEALTQQGPRWMRSSGRDPLVPVTVPEPFAEIARRCLRVDPAQRCTLAEINAILHPAAAIPEPMLAAGAVTATSVIAAEEIGPAQEAGGESMRSAVPEAQAFRRSLRSVEEEEPGRRFPIAMVMSAAVLLFMLIMGIFAYSHRAAPAAGAADESGESGTPQAAKAIKPLPQPSGPTVKGQVAERVVPEIPERVSQGIRGNVNVKVKLVVDHAGAVMNASIESAGRSRYFDNQALEAARKWRFRPAKIHGVAASSVWELRFDFKNDGTNVTPVELRP
jgi:TonB family protein